MRDRIWLLTLIFALGCSAPHPQRHETNDARPQTSGLVSLPPDSPKLKQLRIQSVAVKEFPLDEVVAPGKVELNPNRISRVLPPLPGRVRQVLVRLGDAVQEGQPLLTIESREVGDALSAYLGAQAQLRQARAVAGKAEKDLVRLRDLYEHRAAALKDVIAAETELAQARASVEQAEAVAEEARHRLEMLGVDPARHTHEVVVRAPIAGKVLEISVAPGEYRNDTSAPLMTVADLSTVWVSSQVPESSIRLIHLGERIQIELAAFPGEIFEGRVRRIADLVDPQTRTVKVQAELDNRAGRLRPEMFGAIRHSHGRRTLPVVPAAALVRSDNETWVYREQSPGVFERVRVQCGESRNGLVPVFSGLRPADRVVAEGAVLLAGS